MPRIRDTDVRDRRFRRIIEEIDKDSKSGAMDTAMKHYLKSLEDTRQLADNLEEEFNEEAQRYAPGSWEISVSVELVRPEKE